MKELYPTSAVWPYVLAGVVAITCIVAPTDWQEYGYQVFLKSKEYVQHRLYSSKRTLRQQSSKVVVAFDPVEQANQAKKEAEMAPMIASVAMDSSPRQPVTSPTGKQEDEFAAKPVTTSIGRADAQVWIPPHD